MRLPWRRDRNELLDEEIRSHLELAIRDRMARGETAEEAAAAARREFGNAGLVKEVTREAWGWSWLERLTQDLRYGLRLLRRTPAFTAVAGLSLALGIGANTAIFSVIDALMLRTLPVPHPEQLTAFGWELDSEVNWGRYPYPVFDRLRNSMPVFSGVTAAFDITRSNVIVNGPGGGANSNEVQIALVSGNYFSTLGVKTSIGRTLTPEDDRAVGSGPVTVIGHGYWKRRFALSPDVIGRTITISGAPLTVVGVAAESFTGDWVGRPIDMWVPITMQSQIMPEQPGLLSDWGMNFSGVRIGARLNPGVTIQQGQAASTVAYRQAFREWDEQSGHRLNPAIFRRRHTLIPAGRGYAPARRDFVQPLALLMTIVGLGLLIACANVANLLLARSAARQREIAVRLTLGAGPFRIVRQLLTESVLLALLAAPPGLLFAQWGTAALLKTIASGVSPIHLDIHPDARIVAFTVLLCLLTGFLFGLAPALRARNASVTPALKGSDDRSRGARFGFGKALVIAQVALSLALMIGAGLFIRTLVNLRSQDLGFDRQHVLLIATSPNQTGLPGAALGQLSQAVQERLSALPGVVSVSQTGSGLLNQGYYWIDDGGQLKVQDAEAGRHKAWTFAGVAPGFFATMGIPLLKGRDFTARDRLPRSDITGVRLAIVNESLARFYFADANPLGRHLGIGNSKTYSTEIIGVVDDIKQTSPRDRGLGVIYFPLASDSLGDYLLVRTSGDPRGIAPAIRAELQAIDRNLPVLKIHTVEQELDDSLAQERITAALSGFFGALAVLLACIGLYGVVSYSVARRTNEIGVRLTLGAAPAQVIAMVLRECLTLVILGIATGLPLALAATRLIVSRLFGVRPADPLTIVAATSIMIAVALFAGLLPARRAALVDPMVALRYE